MLEATYWFEHRVLYICYMRINNKFWNCQSVIRKQLPRLNPSSTGITFSKVQKENSPTFTSTLSRLTFESTLVTASYPNLIDILDRDSSTNKTTAAPWVTLGLQRGQYGTNDVVRDNLR